MICFLWLANFFMVVFIVGEKAHHFMLEVEPFSVPMMTLENIYMRSMEKQRGLQKV